MLYRLPDSVLSDIGHKLSLNKQDLRAFSLVCCRTVRPARSALFRTCRTYVDAKDRCLTSFINMLSCQDSIASAIRTLDLMGLQDDNTSRPIPIELHDVLALLMTLKGLRSLNLMYFEVTTPSYFPVIPYIHTNLTHLTLDNVAGSVDHQSPLQILHYSSALQHVSIFQLDCDKEIFPFYGGPVSVSTLRFYRSPFTKDWTIDGSDIARWFSNVKHLIFRAVKDEGTALIRRCIENYTSTVSAISITLTGFFPGELRSR